MNIIELQDNLKELPDNALMQEMQSPTGNAPQFLVLSELKRRKRMRDEFQRQKAANIPTVAEEAITAAGMPQQGIMQAARAMAPKSSIAQNTGMDTAVPMQPTQAPQQPQMMADGGILNMFRGGRTREDMYRQVEPYPENDSDFRKRRDWNLRYGMTHNLDGSPKRMSPSTVDFDAMSDDNLDAEQNRIIQQEVIDNNIPELRSDQPLPGMPQVDSTIDRDSFGFDGNEASFDDLLYQAQDGERFPPIIEKEFSNQIDLNAAEVPTNTLSPISYNNLLSKAQSGVPITENDIVQSVEAGLLNDQQAADINSIIDDPSYMPSQIEQEIANNPADLSFPDVPTNPDLLFPKIAGGISDYVGGVFGGRTIGDQAEIDAARKKQAEDYRKYEDSGGFSNAVTSIESPVGSMTDANLQKMLELEPLGKGMGEENIIEMLRERETAEEALQNQEDSFDQPNPIAILTGGDTGGGASSTVGDSYSTLEGRIAKMLDDREKSAESDKYLALAQAGLALMASDSPTLGGAIGEAGLVGISQMREARNQYDKDILGLLGTQADIDAARSDASLAERKLKMQERELEASLLGASDKQIDKMIDDTRAYLNTLQSEARSYRRVEGGDGALTEDRVIDMIPDGVKADIVTTTERLKTLERLRSGNSTEFDATKQ